MSSSAQGAARLRCQAGEIRRYVKYCCSSIAVNGIIFTTSLAVVRCHTSGTIFFTANNCARVTFGCDSAIANSTIGPTS